jgi:hypothetical protein
MNEILDALRTAFSTALTTSFTTYFKGQVKIPAQSDLPLLSIYPIRTEQSHSGTLRDKVTYTIGVEIHISLKQYFDNTTGQGTQLDTLDALVNLVENRDANGDLEDATVMGAINNNLTVGGKVLYTDSMKAEYEQYLIADEFPAAKVTITFEAFDRPNR